MSDEKPEAPSRLLKDLREGLKESAAAIKEDYEKSSLKKKVEEASKKAKQVLDETGVTDAATTAYEATQEHLDAVSGAKILRLVEERLEIQARSNDILATMLDEALKRIEDLERRVSGSDRS